VHPSDYAPSFAPIRIWEERDKDSQNLVAIRSTTSRGAPSARSGWTAAASGPDAMHSAMGFSTGKWDGDILTVTTTHLKEGWIRRNGITRSDRATVTEHFIKHDNRLTLVTVVSDPIYMTETHVRSRDYEFENNMTIGPYPCEPVDEIDRPAGVIPHHCPAPTPSSRSTPRRTACRSRARAAAPKRCIPSTTRSWLRRRRGGEDCQEMSRRTVHLVFAAVAAWACSSRPAWARSSRTSTPLQVRVLKAQGNVYMLTGAGGNVTVRAG
jgi:hypothetical protein